MEIIKNKTLLNKLSEIIKNNDCTQDVDGKYNEDGLKYVEVDGTDWEIDYKDYASKQTVFEFVDMGVYVSVTESRSGSYYSDYYYDEPDFTFCEPKKVMITSYVSIKVIDDE